MDPATMMALGYGASAVGSGLQSALGHKGKFKQLSTMSPQQLQFAQFARNQGQNQIQNPYAGFAPIRENMQNLFQQQTLPGVAEGWSSMGQGNALSSGTFGSQLGAAQRAFGGDLAAMMAQYGLQNQHQGMRLAGMGMAPEFKNMYIPGGDSGWGSMFGALGQGGGAMGQVGAMGWLDQMMNKSSQRKKTSQPNPVNPMDEMSPMNNQQTYMGPQLGGQPYYGGMLINPSFKGAY